MHVLIDVIYGGAGCGKTQKLAELAISNKHTNYVILAPTHAAVGNLYRRFIQLGTNISADKFKTTYSYFRINWEENDVIGPVNLCNVIYIDEFGLIKKELFERMMSSLYARGCNLSPDTTIQVILAGDVVQLSPIYTDERYISLTELTKNYKLEYSYVIEHDWNSIFSLDCIHNANKTLLTVNHRSNNEILQLINQIFYLKQVEVIKYVNMGQAEYLIENEGYVFISSKYEHHKALYQMLKRSILFKDKNAISFNNLVFYEGSQFMVVSNSKLVRNGDILVYDRYEDNRVIFRQEIEPDEWQEIEWFGNFQIIPANFLTSHKSQGLSIDKVIVCVDDMFDISMFYTMCTRAISQLKFFRYKECDLSEYLERFYNLLLYYKYAND